MTDIWEQLKHQSLGKPVAREIASFAATLESIYIKGIHDFDKVCGELNAANAPAPLSGKVTWTVATLTKELQALNAKLDKEYEAHGLGA